MTQCQKCRPTPCRCVVGDGESIKVSFAMADAAIRDDDHGQTAYEKRVTDAWKRDPAISPFVPSTPAGLTPQQGYERRTSEAWRTPPATQP